MNVNNRIVRSNAECVERGEELEMLNCELVTEIKKVLP